MKISLDGLDRTKFLLGFESDFFNGERKAEQREEQANDRFHVF